MFKSAFLLRYAFPAVFLATGFARRSSVTGDSFMAVASLLLLPTCLTGCSEPSTWRTSRLAKAFKRYLKGIKKISKAFALKALKFFSQRHLLLLIVTALVAIASLTVQILCRAGSLSAPWRSVSKMFTMACHVFSTCLHIQYHLIYIYNIYI